MFYLLDTVVGQLQTSSLNSNIRREREHSSIGLEIHLNPACDIFAIKMYKSVMIVFFNTRNNDRDKQDMNYHTRICFCIP